ncbi:hypothetical protein L9F63_028184 [Diploptera punctata]|uniref:Hexosyltransferase n=1 Tax=Diploptera punctata TaxID=6984 RepID=A0AAD7ZW49_DIPPU|nr:hypothetical protein L9F63_028184 [Diploptera punctata]
MLQGRPGLCMDILRSKKFFKLIVILSFLWIIVIFWSNRVWITAFLLVRNFDPDQAKNAVLEELCLTKYDQLCPPDKDNIKLLILVHSKPYHREKRNNIRMTWGGYKKDEISVIFVIGTEHVAISLGLLERDTSDLICIVDEKIFNNRTRLATEALRTAAGNCPRVPFVFKTEDLQFINTPKLLQFVKNHGATLLPLVYGHFMEDDERDRKERAEYLNYYNYLFTRTAVRNIADGKVMDLHLQYLQGFIKQSDDICSICKSFARSIEDDVQQHWWDILTKQCKCA